jgi:hypothetical protein
MSAKEAENQEEIINYLEVREFGRGRANEQGEKIKLDHVHAHPLEKGEDIIIFPNAKKPLKARLRQPPDMVHLIGKNNVIFFQKGQLRRYSVNLPLQGSVVVRSSYLAFDPYAKAPDIPTSSITHLKGPRKEEAEAATSESPAQPEPQGSPPQNVVVYPAP